MVGAVTEAEFSAIVAKCRTLPPAKGNYLIDDYIENLLLTVLDFQLHTIAVERAMQHYGLHQREAIRTHHNLEGLLARHPDTREGNLQVAQLLWGYNLWSRVELLRRLVAYLEANGVTTQANLQAWASRTDFKEFDGKVKGAGLAIFKWLTMRLGVETIKPDTHIHQFLRTTIGRSVKDTTAVSVLERAATDLGLCAYELDWRIWEYQRNRGA